MKLIKFLLLMVSINCFAQEITTAKLKPVMQNGLHKVVIPAAIRSASKADFSDFRIYDSANKEVPYALINSTFDRVGYKLSEFKILLKEAVPNKRTTIVIENPKNRLEEITLKIANAEVTKKFSISGSDDQKNWFGLINSRELSEIKNERTVSDLKTIPLPVTSYNYLKLVLNDSLSLPIKVDAIGYIDSDKQTQKSENITPEKFEIQNQSAEKKTVIAVQFTNPQFIQDITFNVKSPALYKRQVRLYRLVTQKVRRKTQIVQQTIENFELNPSTTHYQLYNPILEKGFFIEIDNRDNPPMEFNSIIFSQKRIAVAVDLKSNETYSIKSGQSLPAPDYDLSYFKSDINRTLPETEITDIQRSKMSERITAQKSFWQQPWFMWVCIGLGGLAILYFSLSLAKDVQKK